VRVCGRRAGPARGGCRSRVRLKRGSCAGQHGSSQHVLLPPRLPRRPAGAPGSAWRWVHTEAQLDIGLSRHLAGARGGGPQRGGQPPGEAAGGAGVRRWAAAQPNAAHMHAGGTLGRAWLLCAGSAALHGAAGPGVGLHPCCGLVRAPRGAGPCWDCEEICRASSSEPSPEPMPCGRAVTLCSSPDEAAAHLAAGRRAFEVLLVEVCGPTTLHPAARAPLPAPGLPRARRQARQPPGSGTGAVGRDFTPFGAHMTACLPRPSAPGVARRRGRAFFWLRLCAQRRLPPRPRTRKFLCVISPRD